MPKGETSRGDKLYKIWMNTKQKVYVKDIGKRLDVIIVSVKPYIPYPLQDFRDKYNNNQKINNLTIVDVAPECVKLKYHDNKQTYDAILFKSEITSQIFIKDCRDLFHIGDIIPSLYKPSGVIFRCML